MRDVVVVGGGVIGLSIAYELAGQGVDVTVLERGDFGQEASWAGAGILPPGNPQQAHTPQARLRAESCSIWPTLSEQLLDQTGIAIATAAASRFACMVRPINSTMMRTTGRRKELLWNDSHKSNSCNVNRL